MSDPLLPKNLVGWRQGSDLLLGVVLKVEHGRIRVRFDEDQADRDFAWPSDVLERVVLGNGQHVTVLASNEIGVVQAAMPYKGMMLYKVGLSGGQAPTVVEDGIRPAVLTDPVQRLRAGELHSARRVNLRLAATRLLFAYQHDELSTLGNSRVEIKPHQVGVVHRVANSYPHRYILADEVGLGKTIEAGLLIRELRARGVAPRVLILTPSGLLGQWQQELKTKFNLAFSLYNSDSIRWLKNEHPSENVWTLKDSVIASTSYTSFDPARWREIAGAGWDLIIVDEAHHVRRTYQGPGKTTATRLYRLVEHLSDPDLIRAQSMLLLTATPMQLHRFELYSLVDLLDPALFPTYADFDSHVSKLRGLNATVERLKRWSGLTAADRRELIAEIGQWLADGPQALRARAEDERDGLIEELEAQHRLSRVMVRNRKRTVGGFMPRVAAIWEVHLTPEEQAAQRATEEYLRTGYARSKAVKNNALGFLMSTFQKMSASSSHALKRSLQRRIEKLEAVTPEQHKATILDETSLEELPTADALDALLSERMDLDWEEVRHLEAIVGLLDSIKLDSKTRVLIEQLGEIADDDPDAKVIIFTQFRDTQDDVAAHLAERWQVHLFHGGLPPQEKDAAVARFRDGTGPQILLSTEAGGEGRNFQFCHILINYDLPWNPMKVEQRIGRLDRIGQPKPVKIFNFSTVGTIEERVVEVLTNRIGVFRETIGGLDPILGEVESDLKKIFLAAEQQAKREMAALSARLKSRVAEARTAEVQLADLIMDTHSYRKDEVEQLLQRTSPVRPGEVRRFVLGALKELGVQIKHDEEHHGVYHLRFNTTFERRFPEEARLGRERAVTFDLSVALAREELDFLAFGHPIVDGLVELARRTDLGGITSYRTVLSDEVEPARGWFFVHVLELRGMAVSRELVPIFIHVDGHSDDALARWLLDRSMSSKSEDFPQSAVLPHRGDDFAAAVSEAETLTVTAMLGRQEELEGANGLRLDEERSKQERFFEYRAQAAADKLTANKRTLDRLRISPEDDDRRILPVWEKNVATAERMLESVGEERARRLGELDGRDHVNAQHEPLSASFVSIEPDPAPLFEQVRAALTPTTFLNFRRLCERTTAATLAGQRPVLAKRRDQLLTLAKKHRFDVDLAVAIADALDGALDGLERLTPRELNLLSGAIGYFLLLDDEIHDLKRPDGFEDDRQIVNLVVAAIGRPELRVDAP